MRTQTVFQNHFRKLSLKNYHEHKNSCGFQDGLQLYLINLGNFILEKNSNAVQTFDILRFTSEDLKQ